MQVRQRQGKSGDFIINFQIRENQRISPIFDQFKDLSGDFIADTEKSKGYMIFVVDFPTMYLNFK